MLFSISQDCFPGKRWPAALTQGLHRISLLGVAALQRGHVLEGVPDHQLQLVQSVLLESDVNHVTSHPAL